MLLHLTGFNFCQTSDSDSGEIWAGNLEIATAILSQKSYLGAEPFRKQNVIQIYVFTFEKSFPIGFFTL